jgi:hypothetical protein
MEVLEGALVKHSNSSAGVARNMLRTRGAVEYKVKANSVAETVSKKSASAAMGVYGANSD